MHSFMQNWQILTFRTKNALFGYFLARVQESHCLIWNQALKFVWLQSFVKNKNPTKNAWFAYFLAGIWEYYSHISNQRPQICLLAKFGAKIKLLKSWTKNTLFWYLWARVWKRYCHNWNQSPQICLNANFAKKQKSLNLKPKMYDSDIFGLEI